MKEYGKSSPLRSLYCFLYTWYHRRASPKYSRWPGGRLKLSFHFRKKNNFWVNSGYGSESFPCIGDYGREKRTIECTCLYWYLFAGVNNTSLALLISQQKRGCHSRTCSRTASRLLCLPAEATSAILNQNSRLLRKRTSRCCNFLRISRLLDRWGFRTVCWDHFL